MDSEPSVVSVVYVLAALSPGTTINHYMTLKLNCFEKVDHLTVRKV